METVVVAFESERTAQRVRELLEEGGTAACVLCRSGGQVRRVLSSQACLCVVCGPRLLDGPSEWLVRDLPPTCTMLLVGAPNQLELWEAPEVVKLAAPVRKEELAAMVELILRFGRRMERLLHGRRGGEARLVERAKGLLEQRRHMTEEEAHRYLQRRSMDAGLRMAQTARQVLSELEEA